MDRIAAIKCGRRTVPLAAPYVLAHGTLTAFDVVWVWVRLESGHMGIGEGVALPGYGDETADDIERAVRQVQPPFPGSVTLNPMWIPPGGPFARSAVLCAVQMAQHARAGWDARRFAMTQPGRRVKAQGDFPHLTNIARADVVDFNESAWQSPTSPAWAHFASAASPTVAEQPYGRDAWRRHRDIAAMGVRVRLDESVWSERDIRDAALIGCGVKLKVAKLGGIDELAAALRFDSVESVGNGVATDITAVCEMLAIHRAGWGGDALECNGWTRTVGGPLLFDVANGDHVKLPSSDDVQAAIEGAVDVLEAG